MNTLSRFLFTCLVFFNVLQGFAQNNKGRLQPGRLYEPGETLYAPRFGFIAKVPEGWEGMLPRETEVFLLMTTTSTYGEVFMFGREKGDLTSMREAWIKGFVLSETMRLKATAPIIADEMLMGEVIIEGEYINKAFKGFAVAKCNPSGPCITTLMVAPEQYYEAVKATVVQVMRTSSFEPPSTASPYAKFDWNEFLSNKVLVTYGFEQGGSKESEIHLCADGTFSADIKKTGFMKNQNPEYRGRSAGKWTVTGTGPSATIQFTFSGKKSIPVLEAPVLIEDEKVLSNGERYFVGQSDKCK
jgi:hypothetical protein